MLHLWLPNWQFGIASKLHIVSYHWILVNPLANHSAETLTALPARQYTDCYLHRFSSVKYPGSLHHRFGPNETCMQTFGPQHIMICVTWRIAQPIIGSVFLICSIVSYVSYAHVFFETDHEDTLQRSLYSRAA